MIDYSSEEFINIIRFWGYPAMFFLMVLEGPVATMSSAFLASMGYFNIGVVYILSVIGDMIGDAIFYYIGYRGGNKAINKAEKLLRLKKGLTKKLQDRFKTSGGKIVFTVKTTTGLSWITFITAGAVKMDFRRFLKFSFLGGLSWSAILVSLGLFFGFIIDRIGKYIEYAGYFILLAAIIIFVFMNYFKKSQTKKIAGNNGKN